MEDLIKVNPSDLDPVDPPTHDMREPVAIHDHYRCRANCDRLMEQGCTHYAPTMATVAGEVSVCRHRGKHYPIGGYIYCSLDDDVVPRF